jgi:hypothetical protein
MVLAGIVVMATGASAQTRTTAKEDERGRPEHEVLGVEVHPYIEFNSDRVSGHDAQWTNGVSGGVELDFGTPWIGLGYTLHDVLSERQTVPWDGTAYAKLGLYQGGIGSLGSVPTFVHAAVVLAVPTGPDKLSLGVEAGFEFDVDPLYAGLRYTFRDTWVGDDDEVYPWDGEFGVALGIYW